MLVCMSDIDPRADAPLVDWSVQLVQEAARHA
jgi:hypothetical protein